MAAEYHELIDLQKKISSLKMQEFYEACIRELAQRLLAMVIKRTPVGVYEGSSGKKGGTLRRGWTGGQKNANVTDWVKSLNIEHSGSGYTIEITNPVAYAEYVEYGHRTRGGKGYVSGRMMMTISEAELQRQAPAVIQKKIDTYLKETLNT